MRVSCVAGYFYPKEKQELSEIISNYLKKAEETYPQIDALGGICPHAGYIYSGETAAITYSSIANLKNVETVIILGPNHTGKGSEIAISLEDWETPLGIIECDKKLAQEIQKNSKISEFDERAHAQEHSIEVQIPFIQKINPKAKIVSICMMNQDYESAKNIGDAFLKTLNPKKHLVIASSDFSHYLPAEAALEKDKNALEYIEKLDGKGFQKALIKNAWSICGYGPITVLIEYAKAKGIKGKTLKYTNSGEVNNDFSAVVGYSSIIFPKKG